jgi:peptidoglycan/LPS O-acetylase OafA/YrhL
LLLCSLYHRRMSVGNGLNRSVAAALIVLIAGSLYGASRLLEYAPQINATGNVPYYLLHDGILLPAQVALVYLCLFIRLPENAGFIKWSKRMGGASLPMFAFHVPIFIVYSRIQRVAAGQPELCLGQFKGCMASSGPLEMIYYPFYLAILFTFCVLFQERVVVACRKAIIGVALKPAKGLKGEETIRNTNPLATLHR